MPRHQLIKNVLQEKYSALDPSQIPLWSPIPLHALPLQCIPCRSWKRCVLFLGGPPKWHSISVVVISDTVGILHLIVVFLIFTWTKHSKCAIKIMPLLTWGPFVRGIPRGTVSWRRALLSVSDFPAIFKANTFFNTSSVTAGFGSSIHGAIRFHYWSNN